jgi:hypothetical protein
MEQVNLTRQKEFTKQKELAKQMRLSNMEQVNLTRQKEFTKQKGFTLIELAFVLILQPKPIYSKKPLKEKRLEQIRPYKRLFKLVKQWVADGLIMETGQMLLIIVSVR